MTCEPSHSQGNPDSVNPAETFAVVDSVLPNPPIRVTTPDALIAAVPYLLGFHPERSLVVIWAATVNVPMVMRVDLPPADTPPDIMAVTHQHLREAVIRPASQVPTDASPFLLVYPDADSYETDAEAYTSLHLPYADLVSNIADDLMDSERELRDALCVSDGRWWSYLCTSDSCCDICGNDVNDTISTEVAAHFVMAGRAPLSRRADIEAELTSASPANIKRVRSAITALGVKVSPRTIHDTLDPRMRVRCWRTASAVAQGVAPTCVDDQALLLLGLRDARVRDAFLALAVRSGIDRAAEALAPVVPIAPRRFRAQAAGALAMLRYLSGDGARAWVAIDASNSDAQGCRLTELVTTALLGGIPPRLMRETFLTLDPHRLLRGEAA